MDERQKLDFLLGAVSPTGFAGYFDQMLKLRSGWHSLLIKAGPGCGKSTMMGKIAGHLTGQGETVELIHCSSDPDSLDGVVCSARKFSIVDATAPHSLEPKCPVAVETVVSLYDCIDEEAMREHQNEVFDLFGRCGVLQERAARYITAAGSLISDSARVAFAAANLPAARSFAAHLALKYLPRTGASGEGSEELRILSANTLKGPVCYRDTVAKVADTIVVLQDDWGAVSRAMMKVLRDAAVEKGYDVITCYCPMAPHDKIDHLLIPSAKLAFVTSNRFHPMAFEHARVIHCTRFCDNELLRAHRSRLRFNHKAAMDLFQQASKLQAEAKQNHDQLEEYYKAAADFSRIDEVTAAIIGRYC